MKKIIAELHTQTHVQIDWVTHVIDWNITVEHVFSDNPNDKEEYHFRSSGLRVASGKHFRIIGFTDDPIIEYTVEAIELVAVNFFDRHRIPSDEFLSELRSFKSKQRT